MRHLSAYWVGRQRQRHSLPMLLLPSVPRDQGCQRHSAHLRPAFMPASAGAGMLILQLLGKSKWVCDACLCIPKWSIEDAQGKAQYTLRPDVCLGCVSPRTHRAYP